MAAAVSKVYKVSNVSYSEVEYLSDQYYDARTKKREAFHAALAQAKQASSEIIAWYSLLLEVEFVGAGDEEHWNLFREAAAQCNKMWTAAWVLAEGQDALDDMFVEANTKRIHALEEMGEEYRERILADLSQFRAEEDADAYALSREEDERRVFRSSGRTGW